MDRGGEGGHNAILMGIPGQGKTTLLEYLAVLAAKGVDLFGEKREPKAGIWRARRHDKYLEFFHLGIGRLMLPQGSAYTLLKVFDDGRQEEITIDDLEEEGLDYAFYAGPKDIVDKLEVGKILCILFPGTKLEETKFYADLFEALINRRSQDWVDVSIDEAGDILGPYTGDSWLVQKKFIDGTADFRKTLIDSRFGCHAYTDLDQRLWAKVPYHIYKRGAKRMKGDTPRLKQETINNTQVNEAWITYGAFFDKFTFPDMKPEARLNYRLQTVARRFVVQEEKI